MEAGTRGGVLGGGAGRTMGLLGIGMRDGVIMMEGQGRVPLYESLLTMMSVQYVHIHVHVVGSAYTPEV